MIRDPATMEKLNSEDGQLFIKNLASFVRTHEKALANALQLRRQSAPSAGYVSSTSSTLAAALSFGALKFTSHNVKPAKLTLTPHHLFYLLSQFEELSIPVGSMNVRLQNIHNDSSSAYVSFLNQPRRSRGDRDSIHSVSSVRSVMSGMSSLWSSFGIGSKDSSKSEKAKAALDADLKYLYSAFTKIPCLRLAPDHRARLIRGYEEFPLDTAVPLHAFKNLSALEIIDIDYRSFYGWDRLSEQLRTLTLKRAHLEDPADLLTKIVLDDIDKRRRRPSRSQASPVLGGGNSSGPQPVYRNDSRVPNSAPGSPAPDSSLGSSTSPKAVPMIRGASEGEHGHGHRRAGSYSPTRPPTRQTRHSRTYSVNKLGRSGSGSSQNSSEVSLYGNRSSSNLLTGVLPATKWRFLRHLGLPDNSLTSISANSFTPVANTLHSLDLSSNLFTQVPDSLASLMALRALNLSNCMIDSLRSIAKNPLPAITALNLRGNRLSSLAGIERLLSLERLDLRDNDLTDPTELARLTGLPEIREIWISGNPFTKTHSGHRVTIFNLFRSTPGYAEDIVIDASGPGYSERKQLVERAAERESAPVVRPVEPEMERTVSRVLPPTPSIKQAERVPQGRVEGSERRKKNHRRRIADVLSEQPIAGNGVDTFQGNIISGTPFTDPFTDPFTEASDKASKKPVPVASVEPVKKAVVPTPQKDKPLPVVPDLDWHATSDAYRQKLEALRQDVGSSAWLGVLSDETWRQSTVSVPRAGTGFDTPLMRPTVMNRPGSQMIMSGQTLG
ncbi:putative leucine-rich repeat-containing protein C926,06c [Talaromyces islandicus]|uniref:Putative leucine-rich repeat-containing protein C926,06c n=1 Tax=Talaromyces islandicus TaxID=28573 RepID=A0A0U1M4A5_TALIS|nr:putative leucine-rich repeat-containing protein C926,06c [Talaromyces islandicus]